MGTGSMFLVGSLLLAGFSGAWSNKEFGVDSVDFEAPELAGFWSACVPAPDELKSGLGTSSPPENGGGLF